MFKPLRSLAVLALSAFAFLTVAAGSAAEPKPAVVVSLPSADQLLADLDYLCQAVEQPDAAAMAKLVAGPYLASLDRKQPAGIYITFDKTEPQVVGFAAVKTPELLVATLKESLGPPVAVGDDGWQFDNFFLKQSGEWMFIAHKEAHLADLPKDPVALLGGLEKKYTIAARGDARLIPQAAKDQWIEFAKEKLAPAAGGPTGEVLTEYLQNYVAMYVNGTQEASFGWIIDAKAGKTSLELDYIAIPASPLAKFFADMPVKKAPLNGFDLPTADVYARRVQSLSENDQKMLQAYAEIFADIDDPTAQAMRKLMTGVTLYDQAFVLTASDDELNGVVGLSYSREEDYSESVLELIKQAQMSATPAIEAKFDAARHEGVTLHRLKMEGADPNLRSLFGDTQNYVVGVGPGRVYFAFGKSAEATLKKVLDRARTVKDTDEVYVARAKIGSLAKMLAKQTDHEAAKKLAELLDKTPGSDKADITMRSLADRIQVRAEVHEGVLRAIGAFFATVASSPPPVPAF